MFRLAIKSNQDINILRNKIMEVFSEDIFQS
jgi:hypothetical protein